MTRLLSSRRSLTVVALAAALAACGGSDDDTGLPASSSAATAVVEWNAFASDLAAGSGLLPPVQTRAMAIVQIAVHDAVNAVQPKYRRYAFTGAAKGGALPAAVAAASRTALVALMPPAAAAAIEDKYKAAVAAIADGPAKDSALAAGEAAARTILDLRAGDDFQNKLFNTPYTPGPAQPGVYQLTPPLNQVFAAGWGQVQPFALHTGSQFRSGPPIALNTTQYAQDYDEVKRLGEQSSAERTKEQTEIARFWFDASTREWHVAARKGLADAKADEWKAAYTLATLSIAMADAAVASMEMETKFHYHLWRPITAIHAGDTDGNEATVGDPAWTPLCATPPFPEYNSTHAATGAAAARVLARTVGDEHSFSVSVPGPGGTLLTRSYTRFSDAANEEGVSRIYCGIHYRTGMNAGFLQGQQVADFVMDTALAATGQ